MPRGGTLRASDGACACAGGGGGGAGVVSAADTLARFTHATNAAASSADADLPAIMLFSSDLPGGKGGRGGHARLALVPSNRRSRKERASPRTVTRYARRA